MSTILLSFLLLAAPVDESRPEIDKATFVQTVVAVNKAEDISPQYSAHIQEYAATLYDRWSLAEDNVRTLETLMTYTDRILKKVSGVVMEGDAPVNTINEVVQRREKLDTRLAAWRMNLVHVFAEVEVLSRISVEPESSLSPVLDHNFEAAFQKARQMLFQKKKESRMRVEMAKKHEVRIPFALPEKPMISSKRALCNGCKNFLVAKQEAQFMVLDLEEAIALMTSQEGITTCLKLLDQYVTCKKQELAAKEVVYNGGG